MEIQRIMIIQDAFDKCLAPLLNMGKNDTARAYNGGLKTFGRYLVEEGIDPTTCSTDALTTDVFLHFVDWLTAMVDANGRGLEDATFGVRSAQLYLAGVTRLRNWLEEEGLFDPSTRDMRRMERRYREFISQKDDYLPDVPEIKTRDLMIETAVKRIEAVKETKFDSEGQKERWTLCALRDVAICRALSASGLRNRELCTLRVGAIKFDPSGKYAEAWITGKGGKQRVVFFDELAVTALRDYWKARGWADKSDPVIARHDKGAGKKHKPVTTTTIQNVVSEIAELAGVPFHPHLFRHIYAMTMLEKTHDLAIVQDLLGHSDPKTTRIYARLSADQLRNAYRGVY